MVGLVPQKIKTKQIVNICQVNFIAYVYTLIIHCEVPILEHMNDNYWNNVCQNVSKQNLNNAHTCLELKVIQYTGLDCKHRMTEDMIETNVFHALEFILQSRTQTNIKPYL